MDPVLSFGEIRDTFPNCAQPRLIVLMWFCLKSESKISGQKRTFDTLFGTYEVKSHFSVKISRFYKGTVMGLLLHSSGRNWGHLMGHEY